MGILSTLRRAKFIEAEINKLREKVVVETTEMERHLAHDMPAVVAYRIDNGYLVQVRPPHNIARDYDPPRSGFYYCADHTAIADYIVSRNAREKMNIPSQGDMFADAQHFDTNIT